MIFHCQNFEQVKSFRSWNFRTLSLRSFELSFRASKRLLRTSVSLLGLKLLSCSLFFKPFLDKRSNQWRSDTPQKGSTPHNLWGLLHFYSLHFWDRVHVISVVSQPCGNSNCHVHVRRRRRTSSIVCHYFTRGRNLMDLETRIRLNGRSISVTSVRISNFIRFTLNPLKIAPSSKPTTVKPHFLPSFQIFTTL